MLITAFADHQMCSQLTNLVPVLDGTNYQQWSAAMQSFLMSQGQWKCTKPGAVAPGVTTAEVEAEGEPSTSVTTTVGEEDLASWNKDAEKALGNICLCLHHTIGYQFNEVTTPALLWESLKNRYGGQGLSQAFVEFKGMMDTVIPSVVDPSPALDKIMPHFTHLNKMDWEIPKKIVVMMIIAKAPSSMESIVQLYSTILADSTKQQAEERLDPERIALTMRASWETHQRVGVSRNNQQQATKLSTVKPAGNLPTSPKYSLEFHTPSIEVQSLGTVSSAPTTPEPILVPPPAASPCQEYSQNSALFSQFLILCCTNYFTLLPFYFLTISDH